MWRCDRSRFRFTQRVGQIWAWKWRTRASKRILLLKHCIAWAHYLVVTCSKTALKLKVSKKKKRLLSTSEWLSSVIAVCLVLDWHNESKHFFLVSNKYLHVNRSQNIPLILHAPHLFLLHFSYHSKLCHYRLNYSTVKSTNSLFLLLCFLFLINYQVLLVLTSKSICFSSFYCHLSPTYHYLTPGQMLYSPTWYPSFQFVHLWFIY